MIELIPAIDMIDGKCVRLTQGDYNTKKVYNEDPLEVAKMFEDHGIRRLHVVDLDGARQGRIINYRMLERLATRTSLIIDFGGGLKQEGDLEIAFESGAQMVTGGSIAVKNPEIFTSWITKFGPEKIILGADVKDKKIAISGWEETTDKELIPFIQDYYENVREGHNFESFYNHVTEHYPEILARKHIPKDYFSLESFSLNCGEFLPGRRYENVCKDTGTDFSGKKFIVFELTQIKQDRFLSNLVMGMIFTVIQKKLLSDRRKRGVLIFDEYGETAQMVDTATGTGIHSSVAFCYQKIRKENGAVYTIIQNPDQLPENEHTKNIIANTDMLFVLPTKEVIYQSVIDRFRLTHPGQIALMKSMRNNFSGQRPYSECFMRLGEHYATVTRLEFSREKFLAFQTEGEIWSDLEEKNRRMSMEDAIEEYIREHQ